MRRAAGGGSADVGGDSRIQQRWETTLRAQALVAECLFTLARDERAAVGPALFSRKASRQALRTSPRSNGAALGGARFGEGGKYLRKPVNLFILFHMLRNKN